jgi:hypothetical protein
LSGVGRRGSWGQKSRNLSYMESFFANEWWRGWLMHRENVVEAGKGRVEWVGSRDREVRVGGGLGAKNAKNQPRGLGLR